MKLSTVVGIIIIFNAPTEGESEVQNLKNVPNRMTRDVSVGLDVPCGVRTGGDNRIINGQRAGKHEFPWMVSVQFLIAENKYKHTCGGSVIHPLWIVTAGHCITDIPIKNYQIVASIYDLTNPDDTTQQRSVVYINNLYKPKIFADDIALMKVNEKFVLDGRTVAPICLPDKPSTEYLSEYLGPIVQPGWGYTINTKGPPSHHALLKITVRAIPYQECKDIYETYGINLVGCQVCRFTNQHKGTCTGDSGGPGMYVKDGKYYLWGVVSFGFRCLVDRFPGVSADVSCYGDWIVETINNN